MASDQKNASSVSTPFGILAPAMEYLIDAAQRNVLFFDIMRQRGDQYRERLKEIAPHVLNYKVDLVIDGRTLDRPVNYVLVKVVPPPAIEMIRSGGRSLLLIRVPGMVRVSVVLRPIAKSALP